MTSFPHPTAAVAAVPASTPFVAPEELARRVGRDSLVRLGANESAFGPSPRAIAAMQAAVPLTSWYADPESVDLRTALAAHHGCSVQNLVVGSGIDDLLALIVRTFCAPGDRAVATRGTYPTFAYHVVAHGAVLVPVDARDDGSVDLDALVRSAHEERARVVYLANPDNPSGTFVDREAVARLRADLPSDTLLVLDEAYADFVDAGSLPPPHIDARTVRLRTFSKAYGLAGARIGYGIAAPETIAAFQKIRQHFGLNRTGQIGALAALTDQPYVADVVARVATGRAEYRALAERLGVRTLPSFTNFVCFEIGTRAQAEGMVAALLDQGVFVRKPGAAPIDGYIRVTIGTPAERAAFADVLEELLVARPV